MPGRAARLRVAMPLDLMSPRAFSVALANGERRLGRILYRPQCQGCRECVPIRIPVARFAPNRSQRRAWAKASAVFAVSVGPIEATVEKCRLHDRHLHERGLARHDDVLLPEEYLDHFGCSFVDSCEVRYRLGDRLAAVAIVDVADDSWSAVYTFWDPDLAHLSPGVFSVLQQIELCRQSGIAWLYLGFRVAGCRHMRYKAQYQPHELHIDNVWQPGCALPPEDTREPEQPAVVVTALS